MQHLMLILMSAVDIEQMSADGTVASAPVVVFGWCAHDANEGPMFWEGGWEWARLIGSYDTLGQTPHFYQPGQAA